MKFIFHGDPTGPHQIKFMQTLEFIKGQETDVPDDTDPHVLYKLKKHPAFEQVNGSLVEGVTETKTVKKKKRTLSAEQKAKMKEGREKAKAKRLADQNGD